MKILKILLILTTLNCFSQKVVVVDSVSKEPLPYVSVKYDDSGMYSSDLGVFNMSGILSKKVELSYLGYENKVLFVNMIRDTIFMKPSLHVLNEVIVSNKKKTKFVVKPLKKSSSFGSWVLKPKTELVAILYPNEKNQNLFIEEITIVFDKVIERRQEKSSFKKINAVFRINVYNVKDDLPNDLLFSSKPIEVNSYFGGEIKLNVSDQLIILTKKGISFSVEMIGFYDENKNVISEDSFIRPALTSKTSSSFDIKTYLKDVFNDDKITSINEVFKRAVPEGEKINRNMIIGLKFSK